MRVTRPTQVILAATALAAAGLAVAPATASPSDSSPGHHAGIKEAVPTFHEFKASTYRDADGQFIVNGDEAVGSVKKLRTFYQKMVRTSAKQEAKGSDSLIVNTVGGADDVWSSGQLANLTYCVSTGFGADYPAVVSAMQQGASLWESSSSAIDFVYVPSADASCTTSNSSVLFSVEPTSTSEYIARAFFPSSPDSQRNVLVNSFSLQNSGWAPGNILGHELGHTLGFRHEHTRPEAGTCFEDNNWRPLTPYDSVSIMHYPQCNGGSADLTFSSLDAQGVASLYGS